MVARKALRHWKAWGQGFDPCLQRLLFFLIPFRQSSMHQGLRTIMHSHHPICQVARWPNLMAIIWRSTIGHSQHATLDPKSQTDLHLLGPSLLFTPPFRIAIAGPKFFSLFFYILFHLIYFYFTNQSIIFFYQKTIKIMLFTN